MARFLLSPDSLGGGSTGGGTSPGITPNKVSIGPSPAGPGPMPVVSAPKDGALPEVVNRIKVIEQKMINSSGKDVDWKRQPTATGQGATKVKSFHCKLTGDCLEFMDRQINEWLDAHPNCEVKHVTSTVGEWMGKQMTEPNLIVQMWL